MQFNSIEINERWTQMNHNSRWIDLDQRLCYPPTNSVEALSLQESESGSVCGFFIRARSREPGRCTGLSSSSCQWLYVWPDMNFVGLRIRNMYASWKIQLRNTSLAVNRPRKIGTNDLSLRWESEDASERDRTRRVWWYATRTNDVLSMMRYIP
jgi:hypothetical protein